MQFQITNFRGISDVNLEIPDKKICLVAGFNYQGKTSISQAVAAVVTGTPIPLKLNKKESQRLVHSGAAVGSVKSDKAEIVWPEGTISGTPHGVSKMAAGMESILDMDSKTKAKYLSELLKTDPTKEELKTKLNDIGIPGILEKLWQNIQGLGWDSTHVKAKETGARLKGQWEEVTGERYGSKKTVEWKPAEWDTGLEGSTLLGLEQGVAQEKEFVEASIAHEAVSEYEKGQLESATKSIPDYEEALKKSKADVKKLSDDIVGLGAEIDHLPKKEGSASQPCPKCKAMLRINGTQIILADTMLTKSAKEQVEVERATYSKKLDEISTAHQKAVSESINLERKLSSAREAKVKLENYKEPTDQTGAEDAGLRLQRAESRLKAFKAKQTADARVKSIIQNQSLVKMLSPTGIRQEKLQTKLSQMNNGLKSICDIGGWGKVEIDPNLDVSYNGMPLMLSSGSENYLTRFTLQVGFTLASKEPGNPGLIILDGIDILDMRGRNGLFEILRKYQFAALACSTIYDRKDLPDLSKIGGRSYWVEGGKFA